MNKSLLATLLVLSAAAFLLFNMETSTAQPYSFEQFTKEYQKSYSKEGEAEYRKTIFLRNLIKIQEHNANPTNTYTIGVNQFTDLTQAEFAALYLTLNVPTRDIKIVEKKSSSNLVNGDIDWVANGGVTPVKNQAQCGSCWAFSATAAIESALLIQRSESVSLSEQQLVDCSRTYGNQGCNGGWMDQAFDYVEDHGLTTTSAYPYVAKDQQCKIDSGSYKISGYVDIETGCDDLLTALSSTPVSVAVDASNWGAYRSGVFANCGTAVNHGVLLVGATDGYWKIKNSWAATWGESGYIRLARGNTCAVCLYPSYPQL